MRSPTLFLAAVAIAATSLGALQRYVPRLTTMRIHQVANLPVPVAERGYVVSVGGIGEAWLSAETLEGKIENGKDVRFPTEFDPPHAEPGHPAVTPLTPTAFNSQFTGWTIRFKAKPHGSMIGIFGAAEYTSSHQVPGGYGAVAGPMYDEAGALLTWNKLELPRLQTTTTHFHIFALPGEAYAVTLYRGKTPETHAVTVTVE